MHRNTNLLSMIEKEERTHFSAGPNLSAIKVSPGNGHAIPISGYYDYSTPPLGDAIRKESVLNILFILFSVTCTYGLYGTYCVDDFTSLADFNLADFL